MAGKPKSQEVSKKQLEDYQPGATQEEVIAALKQVAQPTKEPTPRSKKKRGV